MADGDGITWKTYDESVERLKESPRPVFAFVRDEDRTRWLFLREIFKALPQNERLRNPLSSASVPLLVKAASLPPYLQELGAGKDYDIAILLPAGFTPLMTFDCVTDDPASLVAKVADALERVSRLWDP